MWPGAEVQGRGGEYEQQQESPDLEGPAPPLFHIYVNFAWRGNVIFSWAAIALLYHWSSLPAYLPQALKVRHIDQSPADHDAELDSKTASPALLEFTV